MGAGGSVSYTHLDVYKRQSQTLRSSDLRRYYIKYLEHRKMFYHSSAAVRGSQSRHAFPAFPGACCFYSDVVFQLPEVASASAPTRTAKPPRTPRAIFTSSASICSWKMCIRDRCTTFYLSMQNNSQMLATSTKTVVKYVQK